MKFKRESDFKEPVERKLYVKTEPFVLSIQNFNQANLIMDQTDKRSVITKICHTMTNQ